MAKAKDVAGVKDESEAQASGSPEEAPTVAAAEAPAAEKRLVLYGRTQASPGLTGLFRTARTEPLGERLRLVCDATHPGSGPEGTWSLDQMPVEGTAALLLPCDTLQAACSICSRVSRRLHSAAACDVSRRRMVFQIPRWMRTLCTCLHAFLHKRPQTLPGVSAEAEKLFARVARIDLAQNVFKSGKWGRYMCALLNCFHSELARTVGDLHRHVSTRAAAASRQSLQASLIRNY